VKQPVKRKVQPQDFTTLVAAVEEIRRDWCVMPRLRLLRCVGRGELSLTWVRVRFSVRVRSNPPLPNPNPNLSPNPDPKPQPEP